ASQDVWDPDERRARSRCDRRVRAARRTSFDESTGGHRLCHPGLRRNRRDQQQRRSREGLDTMRAFSSVALLLLAPAASLAFEQSFEPPAFVVSVPRVPNLRIAVAPGGGDSFSVHAQGRDAVFAVEITAEASAQAGSSRTCAGTFLRELV